MQSPSSAGLAREVVVPNIRVVRVGIPGTINDLDPRKAVDYVSGVILDQIFEPPYAAIAGRPSAEPLLFEPLRSEDGNKGLQYSAAIRPGIHFSNGTPLTADIAARSLRSATVLEGKAKVDVHGDRVWFILSSPNPRFELTLTQGGCAIVLDTALQIFGTGPYMFEERPNLKLLQRSAQLRLVRNPHDHRPAQVDEIEFHVLRPESDGVPQALIEALRSGSIDLTTALSASDLTTHHLSSVSPVIRPSSSTAFLYMNTSRRPLDTAAARRSIAAAIDLLELTSKTYDRNPAAFVATSALPPSMSRGGGAPRARSVDGSLAGTRLSMLLPWTPRPYLLKPAAVAAAIQKRLADRGIVVSLVETRDSEEYFTFLTSGRFDLALGGWIADTADPADYYEALLSSEAVGNRNFANHARWNHPATDALLAQFRIDPSEEHRRSIEQLIADEEPFLPLMHGQTCAVHGRRIRNVTLSPTGSISLASVSVTA